MTIKAQDKASEREKTPTGLQHAICTHVIDAGKHVNAFKEGSTQHKVVFLFELAVLMEGTFNPDHKDKPFMTSKIYTLSLNEKATLRKHLEGWYGKKIPQEKAKEGLDLETLIGKHCTLTLVENDNGYVQVEAIAPAMKGAGKLTPVATEIPGWVLKLKAEAISPFLNDVPEKEAAADDDTPDF